MSQLTSEQLLEALTLRDLTDPAGGQHCMQDLVAELAAALQSTWRLPLIAWRGPRIVDVADNYDRLGYPPDGPARAARYSRYVSSTRLLRAHTTAAIPSALRALADAAPHDVLIAVPGIVWRRDVIDRLHVGEPHQLDLWRIASRPLTDADLDAMAAAVADTIAPGAHRRAVPADHPYTVAGRELDVMRDGTWIEIGECGLADPGVLAAAGLPEHHGLAMGIGLDRAVMLRKGIDDIRLLRDPDPRIAAQMSDLAPYRPISTQPAARRDLSVMCRPGLDAEQIGDRVREALGARADWVEEVTILERTPYSALRPAARARMGAVPGQENLLIAVRLRHPSRSLPKREANALRDQIYAALHEGRVEEWAPNGSRAEVRTAARSQQPEQTRQ